MWSQQELDKRSACGSVVLSFWEDFFVFSFFPFERNEEEAILIFARPTLPNQNLILPEGACVLCLLCVCAECGESLPATTCVRPVGSFAGRLLVDLLLCLVFGAILG